MKKELNLFTLSNNTETKKKKLYIITLIPALFMTMVCVTYIIYAPEGLTFDNLIANYIVSSYPMLVDYSIDYWISISIASIVSISFLAIFYKKVKR